MRRSWTSPLPASPRIRPVRPLTKAEVAKLLGQPAAGPQSSVKASTIVSQALRKVRRK